MRSSLLALGLACLLAACGTETAPAPSADEAPLLTCAGPPFSATAFERPADAESREGAEGDALRQAITGEPFGPEPTSGWRELGRTDDEVAFALGEPPLLDGYVVLRRDGETWAYAQSGSGCVVRPHAEGFTMARWGLDPEAGRPTAATTEIQLLVNDEPCASGVGPDDRLEEPTVDVAPDAITITFASRPPNGSQNCPSHPPVRRRVQLPEPLGERELLDGGIYPPQPPCRVERGDCVNPGDDVQTR